MSARDIIEAEQLSFRTPGDHSDDWEQESLYQRALAASGWAHGRNSYGWLFDDRLRVKKNQASRFGDEDDETGVGHYELFGMDATWRARYRGWYVPDKQLVTIIDREKRLTEVDELPERLYSALLRQFHPLHWRIL